MQIFFFFLLYFYVYVIKKKKKKSDYNWLLNCTVICAPLDICWYTLVAALLFVFASLRLSGFP